MPTTFLGYPRENGAVGVRNWVAVVSVMDNCNPVTRTIARTVGGCIPVTTLFVRGSSAPTSISPLNRWPAWVATPISPQYCW